jgi:hypothetical protein
MRPSPHWRRHELIAITALPHFRSHASFSSIVLIAGGMPALLYAASGVAFFLPDLPVGAGGLEHLLGGLMQPS